MKIVVAPDSFKGTLSSTEACLIIADAIAECLPDARILTKPMADGGEGTAEVLIGACDGQWVPAPVTGPLPDMKVNAGFAWFEKDKTALVEMASASGLALLSKEQLNPLKTTTYGTGQLIRAACEYRAKEILLAVGGSATVDGGVGAAAALGWQFLDRAAKPIPLSGAGLEHLADFVPPGDLKLPPIRVLCDVDNPLCGPHGAARIYGPQKGATPQMVEQLDKGLANLARLVRGRLNCAIADVPGAGAAGGLAAGAIAFMNATIVSGIEMVMARTGLLADLESADWLITGEGFFDRQSLRGKVVSGVAAAARQSHARIAVIAGQVALRPATYQKLGIEVALPCKTARMPVEYALSHCRTLLGQAARRFAAEWLVRQPPRKGTP